MCPTQEPDHHFLGARCLVCTRWLWPDDNDWPFCSPTCRRIDQDTAVLLLPGPPEEVSFGDDGRLPIPDFPHNPTTETES